MWPVKLWHGINVKMQPALVDIKMWKENVHVRIGEIRYYRGTQMWRRRMKSPLCPVFIFQGLKYISWPNSNLQPTFFIPCSLVPTPNSSLSTRSTQTPCINRKPFWPLLLEPELLLAVSVPGLQRGRDVCTFSLKGKIYKLGEIWTFSPSSSYKNPLVYQHKMEIWIW